MPVVSELVSRFTTVLIRPTILLIFTAGFFLFVWGLVVFIFELDKGGEHQDSKQHMIWGIVGMLIMVSVYGILNLLDNTFNLQSTNPDLGALERAIPTARLFGP